MTPPLYTTRLCYLGNVTGEENSDPVPDGFIWVVRTITACAFTDGVVHAAVGDGGIKVFGAILGLIQSQFSAVWNGYWVLFPGDRIFCTSSSPDPLDVGVDYHASGWELSAP